jgi:archaemetzincin
MLRRSAAVAVATAVLGLVCLLGAEQTLRRRAVLTAEQRKAIVYSHYAASDWPRLDPPKPGDWLSVCPEPGRTYAEYVRTAQNTKSATRDTIYLLPVGHMDLETRRTVRLMAEFAHVFFDSRVTLLPPAKLPQEAYVRRRGQYDAAVILNRMAYHVPDDALALVAITSADLYSGQLEFAFGLASLSRRVAIESLHRYGTPGTPEFTRRALKSFAHETGHVFGIRHCIFYRCCMNGSNSLAESDGQPLHYCPLCHDKLRHALGFDPEKRFDALAAFYEIMGFMDDARVARQRGARLGALAKEEP